MSDERIETIREALASLDATNYLASDDCHNARMVRQAKQLLEAALSRLESGEGREARYKEVIENLITAITEMSRSQRTGADYDIQWDSVIVPAVEDARQALAATAPQGERSCKKGPADFRNPCADCGHGVGPRPDAICDNCDNNESDRPSMWLPRQSKGNGKTND